jgi:hypothetical protein
MIAWAMIGVNMVIWWVSDSLDTYTVLGVQKGGVNGHPLPYACESRGWMEITSGETWWSTCETHVQRCTWGRIIYAYPCFIVWEQLELLKVSMFLDHQQGSKLLNIWGGRPERGMAASHSAGRFWNNDKKWSKMGWIFEKPLKEPFRPRKLI